MWEIWEIVGNLLILVYDDRCQDRKGHFMVETTMWEGRTSSSDLVNNKQQPQETSLGDRRGGA